MATGPVAAPRGDEAPRDDSDATRDDAAPAPLADAAERPPRQQVEVVIPVRTLLVVLAFALLVVLAILSFGTLLSIFLAAVLALGLDPPVGALVRRGWGRGRAALALFAALFASVVMLVLVTAGPVWDQIVEFVHELPAYWDELSSKPAFQDIVSTGGADDRSARGCKELADGAAGGRVRAARHRGRRVRLGPLARHAHVPLAVPADGAADDHGLAVRLHAAGGRARAGTRCVEDSITRRLLVADRQRRDLDRRRDGRRPVGVGLRACRSRSCWP